MKCLRVWVITPDLHRRGGTERCLAEDLVRWRHRFAVRLYTMGGGTEVDLDGVEVVRLPKIPGPQLFRFVCWMAANHVLRWWHRRSGQAGDVVVSAGINCLDAEVIGVHMIFSTYWYRVRRQVFRDVMHPARGLRATHRILYTLLLRRLERRVYHGPATLWAVSQGDARELAERFERPPESVPAIPHGVDAEAFSPTHVVKLRDITRGELGVDDGRLILLVGNDEFTKGVDQAVASLAHLPEDVILAVAGQLDASHVARWAEAAGVGDRVLVWPHIPDVRRYYAAADVLIAPSRQDAFNLPVLEALACGLPAVVSARTGVAELLEHGRHALVADEPEDSENLAGLVRRILDDVDLRERLIREGRALAEECSWQNNAERTADLIEREATTPRILVLTPDPWEAGGVGRATRTLLRALTDLYGGERVGAIPVRKGDRHAELPGRLLDDGKFNGDSAHVPLVAQVLYAWRCVRRARHWRRRLVIVASHPHLAGVARMAARFAGCPYVVWAHGYEVWGRVHHRIRFGLRGADQVWAVSEYTACRLREQRLAASKQVRVLPHGLSPELRLEAGEPAERKTTVLSVGALEPATRYKGIDTLLYGWPAVLRRVPDARLLIVGDGSDRARLERIAAVIGVGNRVRFVGRVSDDALRHAYQQAAAFALPARCCLAPRPAGEGFGLVYLEAGAAGLPVVAGRAGAVPEVVEHERNGILVDPDQPTQVADAIVRLLIDEDLARKLGAEGRSRSQTIHSYERFRERVDEMVRELAGLV